MNISRGREDVEKIIIRLLETARQLDEGDPGEFDFGKLRETLMVFEKMAPQLLQLEKDYRELSNHLVLRIAGRLRALQISGRGAADYDYQERILKAGQLTARRLVELDRELGRECNQVFSSRPNYHRTAGRQAPRQSNQEFKIGG